MLLTQSGTTNGFQELTAEPTLLVATILLIAVSIGWIVVSRMINSEIRRAAYLARRRAAAQRKRKPPPPDTQIWDYPP